MLPSVLRYQNEMVICTDDRHNGWEGGESETSLFFPGLEVLTVHTCVAMHMCSNVHS